MSKKRKYYNLAEERALTIPVIVWRFCAYKTEKDYESGDHYFIKDFLDHTEMKVFSGKHSTKEKSRHNDYCSMYWKIEANKLKINIMIRLFLLFLVWYFAFIMVFLDKENATFWLILMGVLMAMYQIFKKK